MQPYQGKNRNFIPLLANLVLFTFGLLIALGAVEMLMRAFPNLVPAEVRVNPPSRRVKSLIDETYDLKQSQGDLYHLMQGRVEPLAPDQDQVVAHVHMITDANGFRNSPPEKATYDIVALGDSFTRASGVAAAWPQLLAEYSEQDVLNLGEVGFGPQDELKILQQYGLEKQPEWVIVAYFEGNDLYDAAAYDQANPFIITRFGRYILNQGISAWRERNLGNDQVDAASDYTYPVRETINNKELEIVFFSYYISWLSVDREAIESSQNYRLATESLMQMYAASDAAGARFLLVYVPSKEHVYLPYLDDAEISDGVFSDVPTIALDEEGFLQFANTKATYELTRQHMNDQSAVLADFAAANDVLFLDLTPAFQEEASSGAELYYPFDTHWNQQGHALAAETIARYIEGVSSNTTSNTPGN